VSSTDHETAIGIDQKSSMGVLLAVVGLIAMGGAFLYPVGVDGPTIPGQMIGSVYIPEMPGAKIANNDQMGIRAMIMAMGGAFFVGGCVLVAGARVSRQIARLQSASADPQAMTPSPVAALKPTSGPNEIGE